MKAALLTILFILLVSTGSYSVKALNSITDRTRIAAPLDIADTSLAIEFWDAGNNLLNKLKYDSALVYFDMAKMIYEKESLWENYFKCINIIGSVLREEGKIDSSIIVLENVIDSAIEKLGQDNLTYAKTKNLLGYSYMIKSSYEKAFRYANESLAIQLKNNNYEEASDTHYLIGIIYFHKGEFDSSLINLNRGLNFCNTTTQKNLISNIYNTLGQVYSAKKSSDKAIEYYKYSLGIKLNELVELHPEIAVIYNNLAVEYFYKEDNDAAIEYYLKALSIDEKTKESDDYTMGLRYNNLSMAYRVTGDYEKALKYNKQAKIILINKVGDKHPNVGAVINNTGRIYSDLGNYDKAIELYQTAFNVWNEKFGGNHPLVAQALANIGESNGHKGDYILALEMLNKSLSIRFSVFGKKHPKVSESYERIGRIYLEMHNYNSALYSYQKSIISLTEGFEDSSIYANPEPDKILWNNDLLNSLILKGDAFELLYSQSNNLNDLVSAYSCFELSSRLVDRVRHSFKSEGSKLSFSNKTFSIYERGINISLKLFELSKNDDYKKAAFKFSEESKAALLFDAVSEVKARNFSGIPDTLFETEKNLRVDLAYFDTQVLNEKQKKQSSSEKIKELEEKYFSLHQQYLSLLENLEKNYPSYYQLKYSGKNLSAGNLQNALDNESAIVEYFLSDTTMYIFTLNSKNIDVAAVDLDQPVLEKVKQFRQSLQNIDFENYVFSALSLYKVLIEPVKNRIITAKNLIIIPDGILYYLPFEALLSERVNMDDLNFSELPYLINSFNVSYLFSAAFLQEENNNLETNFSFAGFAPVFPDSDINKNKIDKLIDTSLVISTRSIKTNDKTYSSLPESEMEVTEISKLFTSYGLRGKIYSYDGASENNLKSVEVSTFGYLHLATHGFINEMNPKLSGLLFSDNANTSDDGILYFEEIFGLNLKASLVVLSACESGLGKIISGEGILGLTRGFIYAGAENIVVSLWQVADKSTSELMIEFYKNVLERKSYSSSLREAKLKLIKDGTYSYPLEWSPFVLIGK